MTEDDLLIRSLCKPGVHERTLRERFGEASAYAGETPVFHHPLYLLGFSNRSGSNLLAEYLRSTGKLAGFAETLNHDVVESHAERLGLASFPDYIHHVVTQGRDPAIPLAFKASWDQTLMLIRLRIDRMFKGVKIIHITRRDVLRQAISMLIAFQTKRWTSKQTGLGVEPTYDQVSISNFIQAIFTSRRAFALISSVFHFPTIEVTYEDLVADPLACVSRVARFCDLSLDGWRPPKPAIEKQAAEVNDAFMSLYIASVQTALLG